MLTVSALFLLENSIKNKTTATEAPPVTPMISGEASGLRIRPWRIDPAAARQLNPNRLKRRIAEKKKTRPDQQVSPAGLLCTAHPAARNWAATTQTTSAAVFWRQVSAWT